MTMDVNTSDIIRYLLWRVILLLHLCSSLLTLGQAGTTERYHQELYRGRRLAARLHLVCTLLTSCNAGLAGVARRGAIVCISSPPMRGCQIEEQCMSLTCQRRNVWPRKAMAFSWCIPILTPSMTRNSTPGTTPNIWEIC